MAVQMTHHEPSNNLLVIAGYEGGFTAVHLLPFFPRPRSQGSTESSVQLAQTVYLSRPHTQPILSLDASPDAKTYYTSSADAVIAAHRIPALPLNTDTNGHPSDCKGDELSTGVASIRSEAQTSGAISTRTQGGSSEDEQEIGIAQQASSSGQFPDGTEPLKSSPVYSENGELTSVNQDAATDQVNAVPAPAPAEIPSFGKRSVTQPLSFSKQKQSMAPSPSTVSSGPSGLSSLLSSVPPQSKFKPSPPFTPDLTVQTPYKTAHTKHAGQQSLHIRSDGRLLVTGGWDSKVRIYSTKTLKELAVLKWHKEGVYTTDFGAILGNDVTQLPSQAGDDASTFTETAGTNSELLKSHSSSNESYQGLSKLQKQREEQIQRKHWVVAGAKDGKVSLWEVF